MPILNADYSRLDHEAMAEAIGIKPKHIPLILKSFIEEGAVILGELQAGIESHDYENIRKYAHAIKGSAGNIGLVEMYDTAKEIEYAAKDKNGEFCYGLYYDALEKTLSTISI